MYVRCFSQGSFSLLAIVWKGLWAIEQDLIWGRACQRPKLLNLSISNQDSLVQTPFHRTYNATHWFDVYLLFFFYPSRSELSSSPEQVSIPTSSELLTMFEFSQALSYINSHCEKEDADWHNQLQYINAFRYLVQNQLSTFHHYLKHYLPNIRLYLGSIRSIVAKSAMIAFKELFETLHVSLFFSSYFIDGRPRWL